MKKEVLRMERVTYLEQGNVKLKNFNMALYEGEIMGLVPMNNLGLDALLQLLQKNLPLYYGYVYYRNHMVNCWGKPKQEWNRISIIRNESILADDMTVADNIFVLRPGFKKWLIQKKVLHASLLPFWKRLAWIFPRMPMCQNLRILKRLLWSCSRPLWQGITWLCYMTSVPLSVTGNGYGSTR